MVLKIFSPKKAMDKNTVHNALMLALTIALCAWISFTIIICILSELGSGNFGLLGALLGAAVGGAFFIISTGVSLYATSRPPHMMMMITLGAWLVKILVFIVILASLAKKHFYSHPIFAIAVMGSIVFVLGSQVYAMRLKNIPIVDEIIPESIPEDTEILSAENTL